MNPDTNQQNHFNLPPPVAEAQPATGEAFDSSVEQPLAAGPESAGSRSSGPPSTSQAQDDVQQAMPQSAGQTAVPTLAPASAQPSSTTNDALLDKEWVLKAKQIVSQTVNDPYAQNKQLAEVKAGYLQRRYGKVVKLVD